MTETDEHVVNEWSPLVAPDNPNPVDNDVDSLSVSGARRGNGDVVAAGDRSGFDESSKSSWYLFLLTLSIGGLQIVWSVELSNGSPYLLSLGMSKSLLAFVWIAGPLTGALVQPYIGIRSDNCRISWGKRKPFMVVGGAATIVALLCLAWVREIVGGFLGTFGVDAHSTGVKTTTIVVATILMYCLDFSINTVQAGIRAFIVDNAPAHQQESANAWASRLTGVGNILGYISGYLDLPQILPFFGNTQFKVLCVIASISLSTTLLISCLYIKERDPRLEGPPASDNPGLISFFKQVFRSIRRLPPQIRKVCEVQLAAWVGWFPFLFYSTTYIGQLYVNPIFEEHPNLSDDEIDKAWEEATRIGTFALLIYAIVSFTANIILPLIVVPTYKQIVAPEPVVPDSPSEEPQLARRMSFSSTPFGTSSEPLIDSNSSKSFEKGEKQGLLSKLQIPGLTLRRTWLLSHLLFATCMFSTFFIYTPQAATVDIGIVGISWALTLWAPFALISAEVARRDAERRLQRRQEEMAAPREPYATMSSTQSNSPTHSDDLENGHFPKRVTAADGDDEAVDQAGIILGLHNVAISFPQIVSTLISSAIFKALQKPRGEPWDDSVGWVMRFGGCAALVAAWLTKRLDEGVGWNLPMEPFHGTSKPATPDTASMLTKQRTTPDRLASWPPTAGGQDADADKDNSSRLLRQLSRADYVRPPPGASVSLLELVWHHTPALTLVKLATMASYVVNEAVGQLLRRIADSDSDPDDDVPEAGKKEFFSSWALLIMILLLMFALFTSYILQQRKIQAVHETVLSIFAGMFVGLLIRLSPESPLQDNVAFDYQFFFNLLLPPIILASGYELHQANFFRNIGTILTFAFAGTFISAVVLGLILFIWTRIPLDGLNISFVEAISVGATLSATDPVTILAIFNLYKVEPKLYTVIFGESILNDAVAIVLFETAQKYADSEAGSLTPLHLFEAIGVFLLVFFGSMLIGVIVGVATALGLKHTHVRRMPKIESCLIVLVAYASYFFSNGIYLSGIVSLLFCGITLKHYAYYNMSRRTQLTTKYLFQVLAQLSENFIFIYLGLDLFVETNLQFKPLFILVTVFGICVARYLSVFPLSKAINWFIRYRARRRGKDAADELPFAYQAMLFWAGLRGAVGVALAAGMQGINAPALRATVLVVVVLTVIIFGGTTARMLEILGIRTGVVEEIDSDDEFDIEVSNGGTYYKRSGTGLGYTPRRGDSTIALDSYSRGSNRRPSPPARRARSGSHRAASRKNSVYGPKDRRDQSSTQTLLGASSRSGSSAASEDEFGSRDRDRVTSEGDIVDDFELDMDALSDDDLPPSAASRLRRSSSHLSASNAPASSGASPSRRPGEPQSSGGLSARAALRELFSGGPNGDHAAWFRQLDEDYIKPKLLLDQSNHKGPGAV